MAAPIATPAPALPGELGFGLGARQITLTQTVTYAGATATTLLTLAQSGSPPTSAPAPTAKGSNGLTSAQVGIVLGAVLGTVAAALLLWCCCVVQRRKRRYVDGGSITEVEDEMSVESSVFYPALPRRTYWTANRAAWDDASTAADTRGSTRYVYAEY
ncbi:hypothetical protein GGR56DRAFT_693755 [Xylariaceae sp. FL0804]|nr:hypothetical protein GGR56DRAFT_693755 [Xylariaceae sp. FL0804]